MTDDTYRDWDAAYVLGALPTAERLEYERHLETCPACRAAVADLAGVPGLLGRLSAEDAVAIADPAPDGRLDTGPERSLASVAHRVATRRFRRRVLVAVTAGLAVVAAVLAGLAVGSAGVGPAVEAGGTPTPSTRGERYELTPVAATGLRVDLDVTRTDWGTRFDWGCTYGGHDFGASSSVRYDLVVVRTDGTEETVASWAATGRRASGLSAATDVPERSIARVEVRLQGDPRTLAEVDL